MRNSERIKKALASLEPISTSITGPSDDEKILALESTTSEFLSSENIDTSLKLKGLTVAIEEMLRDMKILGDYTIDTEVSEGQVLISFIPAQDMNVCDIKQAFLFLFSIQGRKSIEIAYKEFRIRRLLNDKLMLEEIKSYLQELSDFIQLDMDDFELD
jgi:hypothetical protein